MNSADEERSSELLRKRNYSLLVGLWTGCGGALSSSLGLLSERGVLPVGTINSAVGIGPAVLLVVFCVSLSFAMCFAGGWYFGKIVWGSWWSFPLLVLIPWAVISTAVCVEYSLARGAFNPNVSLIIISYILSGATPIVLRLRGVL